MSFSIKLQETNLNVWKERMAEREAREKNVSAKRSDFCSISFNNVYENFKYDVYNYVFMEEKQL